MWLKSYLYAAASPAATRADVDVSARVAAGSEMGKGRSIVSDLAAQLAATFVAITRPLACRLSTIGIGAGNWRC